jgi:hypothetical protein
MNTFKLSSKSIHKDNRSSIEQKHNETIANFQEYYSTLPEKEEELSRLIKLNDLLKPPERRQNTEKISLLNDEIKSIKNETELTDYLLLSSKFIMTLEEDNYKDNEEETTGGILSFVSVKGKYTNGEDYSKYMSECFPGEHHERIIVKKSQNCSICSSRVLRDHSKGETVCEECGNTEKCSFNDTPEWNDYQTHEISQPFAYKRSNHFKEWLSQIQAKESTSIPESVIDLLLLELKKERILDSSLITSERIKKHLKKLKLNKYYEHIPSIIHIITKNAPLNINMELEKKLLTMFDKIQEPFKKHCPQKRKNFLSYSYTLYKFCQLLKKDEYLIYFPLLKSREKLFEQESIWKKICEDLNWEFIQCI